MLILISFIYFSYLIIKLYISYNEIRFVKNALFLKPQILDEKEYKKAGKYKIINEKFNTIKTFFDYALFLMWISWGLKFLEKNLIKEDSILESVTFLLIFLFINYLFTIPFDLYSTFKKDIEFTTIDKKTYILDQVKSLGLTVIFGTVLFFTIIWIMKNLPSWWIWGFLVMFSITIFINMIYPTIIAPIFNKFTPLEDKELNSNIEKLLSRVKLKSDGVFVVDASKRDKRLNAYFGGLGNSKRVVLYDTLLNTLSVDELLAVLGHELGHFVHKDIVKNIFASGSILFIMFAIFGNLPDTFFSSLNLSNSSHMTIVMFFLLSPIILFLWMPIFGAMSRKNEYKADEYGAKSQSKEALKSALLKLAKENSSFPLSHHLSIIFYHTHPPLVDRVKRLMQ